MFDFTLLTTAPLAWAALAFVAAYAGLHVAVRKKWLRPVVGPAFAEASTFATLRPQAQGRGEAPADKPAGRPTIYYAGALLVATTIVFAALPLRGQPILLAGLVAAGCVCLVGGIWDERRALRPSRQLMLQAVAALCVVVSGWTVSYISQPTGAGVIVFDPWVGGLLAIGWLLLLMNAINWLDGVDGLAAGVGGVALATLAGVSLLPSVQDPLTLALSLIGVATIGGFLIWNFPPARVHLGTSGSWWLGLFIGLVAIGGGGKIVTTLLVLAIPVVDVLLVVISRLHAQQPPWQGDTVRHLHHRLLRRGWPPRVITVTAIAVTSIFGIGAIVLQTEQKIVALIVAATLILIAGSALALTPMRTKAKQVALLGIAIAAILVVGSSVSRSPQPCRNFTEGRVTIGDSAWSVALADTPAEHAQGLMACEYLPPDSGMYFAFQQPSAQSFWMKNMVIPLDIVWIQDDTIIGIERDAPPAGDAPNPPRYHAPLPYTAVLELPAGAADEHGFAVGQTVTLEP